MTRGTVVAEPSQDVIAVARRMREKRIHRVLVCDTGKITGSVSSFDMLTALIQLNSSVQE